ncbi:MAG: hypothetical protein A3B30_02420 [Candidatus Komeilibacteria bacterium RIFCSPLOWO2_01_FULL_52_15]|uniref:Uncharacterized protein n=1 Tax=Candidatus Komeilibacteria bacterium RIFCSPLOWO2_01_FULL_52_15 TaxID=1798551 RepID=A0A1G2BQA3_9BACT|nr:MAG: hypothetical protein A3B30_02420 [Candidatus Komeilibacteria bacterium RIFCSPLOWO2_01_FULL_52_15]
MSKASKIIQGFFTTLGVIFFILLIVLAYLFIADPFNLRPLYNTLTSPSVITPTSTPGTVNTNTAPKTDNPLLSPAQEQALIKIGVDPAKLPTTITPQMEACFVQTLGQKRVDEIKKGAPPTPVDFFAARACL